MMPESLSQSASAHRPVSSDVDQLLKATLVLAHSVTIDELARQSVELARDILGYDRFSLWLIDENASICRGTYGIDENGSLRDERNSTVLVNLNFLEVLRETDKWWHLQQDVPLFDDKGVKVGVGDRVTAAIRHDDVILGFFHFDNLVSHKEITASRCDLLSLYTTAIGNIYARLLMREQLSESYEQRRIFQERLLALHRITVELSTCSSVDDLCRRVVTLGTQHLSFRRMSVWFLDREKNELRGTYGICSDGTIVDESSICLDYGRNGSLYEAEMSHSPWILHDNRPMKDAGGNLAGYGTVLEAPVWDDQRVIGCLYVDNYVDGHPADESDGEIAALYAVLVGHLYARSKAEEAVRRSSKEQIAVHEQLIALQFITVELFKCGSLDELLRCSVLLGHRHFSGTRFSVWLLVNDKGDRVGSYGIDESGNLRDERNQRIPGSEYSPLKVAEHNESRWLLFNDRELLNSEGTEVGRGNLAHLPIWDGSRVLGSLYADNLLSGVPITERDCGILALYASIIGHFVARHRADEAQLQLEESLRQAQKMESVGRLAGGIAHDFNNLLTSVLGNAALVLDMLADDHPAKPRLLDIVKAGDTASDLTSQLLAFSRKQIIDPKVVNPATVVGKMRSILESLISEEVDLQFDLSAKAGNVRVDASQLQQVLINLCVNGSDAMPGGGKLLVELGKRSVDEAFCFEQTEASPGDYITISVTDTGIGMDKETTTHVFEPFFTTKEPGKGTGLGLATVYGIVSQNNGFVTVASQPGVGTQFCVYLPCVEDAVSDEEDTPTSSNSGSRGTETILLVEDEEMVRELTSRSLQAAGYNVVECRNPLLALQIVEEHSGPIDLLLTDVVMPEMNGRDLAEELHRRYPDLKVLFMSGYAEDVVAYHGVLYETTNFIGKPFRLWELTAAVRRALDS